MQTRPLFLNGQLRTTQTTAAIHAPYKGELLGDVSQAGAAEVEQAIGGAVKSFAELRRRPAYKRAETCHSLLGALQARREEFAKVIAQEAGKPIRTARGEVERALTTIRLAGEEATRIRGEQLPVDIDARSANYWAMVERFPVGPCAFFTPFNFPLNLVMHKVAPALACGCPFIVKPSERTPLTALLLGELLAACDLPAGSWSILPCDRAVASQLVKDDRIKLLSFTGSPEVGFKLKADAGKKSVILELGNNSAVIVEPETDLTDAVPRIVAAGFGYAGQSCISVQRIYLHKKIAERAGAMIVEGAKKLVAGDPLDERTDVGPLIDEAAAKRVESWVKDSGGKILCGGERDGSFYSPTVVQHPDPASTLAREEVFGPVVLLETYTDFDDVLQRANNTRYGLQTGIFSSDIHKIRQAFITLEMGGVVINDVPTTRIDNMPYGGEKDSGIGREGVRYAIEHMTTPKVLLVRSAR
jgi:acyl-CoA reductase-like NAD-dependent aldehyde dehydrogenase